VPDPEKKLQAIYLAGYAIDTFERYPKMVGVIKGHCIALMQPTPGGLKLIGRPGWKMGEVLGVMVEQAGRKVFRAKSEVVEATEERLSELENFSRELEGLMAPRA